MNKYLLIYTCLLIVIDLFFSVFLNLSQDSPGGLVIILIFIRIISLGVLFPLVGIIVCNLLKRRSLLINLSITSLIVYLLIPIIITLFNDKDKGLWETCLDTHFDGHLFILIYLPYLLASCLNLLIIVRLKLLSLQVYLTNLFLHRGFLE